MKCGARVRRARLIERTWLHDAALRMARRCRRVIQSCLREEEWRDCDAEFQAVIVSELRKLLKNLEE